ncbi:MAG: septum site-determining protein MinC [Pseudomonadota bacterium]
MKANIASSTAQEPVFELKSGHFTLPNLRLLASNMDSLDEQLMARVQQAPGFFRNTPVVIDLSLLAERNAEIDFPLLVGLMRGYGMLPVAIQGGSARHEEMAEFLELAILADRKAKKTTSPQQKTPPREKPRQRSAPAMIIAKPIRSGQRVYATGRDLIVVASVSSGAEVIADGNIHIYGTLRGRALAGVKGNRESRIFCQNLQAELLAVAGQYRINEQLEPAQLGKPAQIYLSDKKLLIENL